MTEVLEDKRTATRFRILVEIADRQPAVSQEEIASAVGITSQAVSEYIRDLDDEGFVEKEGRSRYRVTNEGVDWLLRMAGDVRRFADRVTEDVLGGVYEDAAIATDDVEAGETVTLSMDDGLLHATPGASGPATGVATTDAEAGDDVGVSGFEGVIDFSPGAVSLYQVPPVRSGGSGGVDAGKLAAACEEADLVLAEGVEAVVAARRASVEPATTFATGDVAAAAAQRGVHVVVIVTADEVGRVTDPLRDAGTAYEVTEWPEN
ncbi:MAG: MarR family transcriptional regulator [Halanaeroarchaeum sp.]